MCVCVCECAVHVQIGAVQHCMCCVMFTHGTDSLGRRNMSELNQQFLFSLRERERGGGERVADNGDL